MALELDQLAERSVQPGAVAWQRARSAAARGRKIHAVDGRPMTARPEYLADLLARTRGDLDRLAIGDDDLWLRAPFGDAIFFEDDAVSAKARPIVEEALAIIAEWRPALAIELRQACRARPDESSVGQACVSTCKSLCT